jgi:two-component sensor histidine kinase
VSGQLETSAPTDLFITDELHRRPPQRTDYLQEKLALQDLARQMITHPAGVLVRLVDLAMEITGGTSGGMSLLEERPVPAAFRWHHVRGGFSKFDGTTTPRDFSPCGVTLDRGETTLTRHPERFYTWISDADLVCPEVLLVPLHAAGTRPLGTLWVVAPEEGFFDSGHARVVAELASFAGIALHMIQAEQHLKKALEQQEWLTREQEMLTKEMSHRVKNLFALTTGMIHLTARSSGTPKEMANSLSGRIQALADASALVRRSFGDATAAQTEGTRLDEVVRKILLPHDLATVPGQGHRFKISGPAIFLGEHATNGFALICHELATNAAKYGALKNDDGCIEVSWHEQAGRLELVWQERDGPAVEAAPTKVGFGSTLSKRTIEHQFDGTLSYDWRREGVVVTLSVPAQNLLR